MMLWTRDLIKVMKRKRWFPVKVKPPLQLKGHNIMKQDITSIKTLTVDLSKQWYHVLGFDQNRKVVFKKKLNRNKFHSLIATIHPCSIVLEACGTAHFWGRTIRQNGHKAFLISPRRVKQLSDRSKKNDFNDAMAIFEAFSLSATNFVPIKTEDQQVICSLHRKRENILKERTLHSNHCRATLREFGIDLPQGRRRVIECLIELTSSDGDEIPALLKMSFQQSLQTLKLLDEQMKCIDKEINSFAETNKIAQELQTVPGIGPVISSAMVAQVGDFNNFSSGRQFAAWLGLVPRQYTTGGKAKLGPITKAGNCYLRKLLVHGCRSIHLVREKKKDHTVVSWYNQLFEKDKHINTRVVALANKVARIIWAVATKKQGYQPDFVPTS